MCKGKTLAVTTILCIILSICSGCAAKSIEYKFSVVTGDDIIVSLDTEDGHSIRQNNSHAYISNKDGTEVLDLYFLNQEMYEDVKEMVGTSAGEEEIVNMQTKSGQMYDRVSYAGADGTNYITYVMWLEGSSTGVMADSTVSVDSAQSAFDHLAISLN